MNLKTIGIIHSSFAQAEGTPIQPAYAGGSEGCVEVFPEFAPELKDLDVLDRTPLLDIKPYVPAFDHLAAERTGWLGAAITQRTVADGRFEAGVKAR